MLKTAFCCCGETQQMSWGHVILIVDEIDDGGYALGQRPGLIEDDCVDLGKTLHMAAALCDDAGLGRVGHRSQHGGWCRDTNACAVVDDHQGKKAVEIS